jgi:hypothetical protein
MKYKGIIGAWKKTEVNAPDVKILSIVTNTKQDTQVVALMFLPKHEITDEIRATAQMMTSSHEMLLALKALVNLKEWKNIHGKDSTYNLNRAIVWAKAEQAIENALNFKQ